MHREDRKDRCYKKELLGVDEKRLRSLRKDLDVNTSLLALANLPADYGSEKVYEIEKVSSTH